MPLWKEILVAAQKAVGKGKLPRPSADPAALEAVLFKAKDAFTASQQDLEKKLLALQNALTQAKNNFQQYSDMVEGNDFGLDKDDPESQKRIAETTKLLLAWLKNTQSVIDAHVQELARLDRAVTDARRLQNLKL